MCIAVGLLLYINIMPNVLVLKLHNGPHMDLWFLWHYSNLETCRPATDVVKQMANMYYI